MDEVEGDDIHFPQRRSQYKEMTGGEGGLDPAHIPKTTEFSRCVRGEKYENQGKKMPDAEQREDSDCG